MVYQHLQDAVIFSPLTNNMHLIYQMVATISQQQKIQPFTTYHNQQRIYIISPQFYIKNIALKLYI